MSENIIDIIQDIKDRADKEYDQAKIVRAIGRGNICPTGSKKECKIWITNIEPEFTQYGTYYKDGSIGMHSKSRVNLWYPRIRRMPSIYFETLMDTTK